MSELAQPFISHSGSANTQRVGGLSIFEPQVWLAGLIVAQLFLWTLIPWLFATSLPLDVVSDGLAWGHEWQWGYYKHPPLPPWAAELSFDILGDIGPFLLSQITITATWLFVFLLGRELMPSRLAAIGTLLLVGVYYFSIPGPEFNHNVAQMPVWAAASFAYYKALDTRRPSWWIALGVAAGLGLLAKYSTALLMATMALHMISGARTRAAFLSPGPWLALAACIAVVSPHLAWLAHNHFPTITYAMRRAGHAQSMTERMTAPFKFLLAQLIDVLPAIAVALFAGLLGRDSFRQARHTEQFRFLLFLTLGPPLLTAFLSLASGMGIRDMWGAPMWNLVGLLLVIGTASGATEVSLPRLAAGLPVLFCLWLIGYVFATTLVPEWENKPSRTLWPDRALAQTFSQVWVQQMHRPLAIVAGDGWLAGLIAMRSVPRPSVWTDGDSSKAPWITPAKLAHDGALVVWRIRGDDPGPPAGLAALAHFRAVGVKQFAWPSMPKASPLRIGYGVVAPAAS